MEKLMEDGRWKKEGGRWKVSQPEYRFEMMPVLQTFLKPYSFFLFPNCKAVLQFFSV